MDTANNGDSVVKKVCAWSFLVFLAVVLLVMMSGGNEALFPLDTFINRYLLPYWKYSLAFFGPVLLILLAILAWRKR